MPLYWHTIVRSLQQGYWTCHPSPRRGRCRHAFIGRGRPRPPHRYPRNQPRSEWIRPAGRSLQLPRPERRPLPGRCQIRPARLETRGSRGIRYHANEGAAEWTPCDARSGWYDRSGAGEVSGSIIVSYCPMMLSVHVTTSNSSFYTCCANNQNTTYSGKEIFVNLGWAADRFDPSSVPIQF